MLIKKFIFTAFSDYETAWSGWSRSLLLTEDQDAAFQDAALTVNSQDAALMAGFC